MTIVLRILLNHNLKRCVYTTAENLSKYAMREGRFMKKMLMGDTSKRKWHINKDRPQGPIPSEKLTSNHVTRRMTVLNNLFMQHITELMATGEASTHMLGRSIEISHVKVTPDFKTVRVYWISRNMDEELKTEQILNDCAFHLRHELTQLRVIGQVPMIKFVKNRQLSALEELKKRFKTADYGEDYEPIEPNSVGKEELTLITKLTPEVRENILKIENTKKIEDENDETKFDVTLPPMRHDALGLDHHLIMTRVKQSLKKSHDGAKNRLANVISITPTDKNFENNPATFQTIKEDTKAFMDFLVTRRLEDKRKLARDKRNNDLYNMHIGYDEYDDAANDYENEIACEERDVDILDDISLVTK